VLLQPQSADHFCFVTGRLAHRAVRETVAELSRQHGFAYQIVVLPITVAALMTPRWLLRHLKVPPEATHIILPGHLADGEAEIARQVPVPVVIGPKDCRDLDELFGGGRKQVDLKTYNIEIIAEINLAPRMTIDEVVSAADALAADGADVIDFGCDPGQPCAQIRKYVTALTSAGHRVSIDSFDPEEVTAAVEAGAELVLSVNSQNRTLAAQWGCEVVVIPDFPGDEASFRETIDYLLEREVPIRLDPILEPIGVGLTASLQRYAAARRHYPELPIMMGIGNLTELSDVDSAGINFLLLGICQELGIDSVLTTQVINWARSAVRECDIARRLVYYSRQRGVPPKRLSDRLVMLRDPKLRKHSDQVLQSIAETIRDKNFRIFAQDDSIHLISSGLHLQGSDPFELFDQLTSGSSHAPVDADHAFYLGFEMAKASIALLLGKQYEQDNALHWGHLTKAESFHRLDRKR